MFDPTEHRLYPVILKLVLWDEEEAKIRKRLSVNEVPEDQAESILATARKERISFLRAKSRENLLHGTIATIIGTSIIGGFYLKIKALHPGAIAGSCVFLIAGLVLIIHGSLTYLQAPGKKGPIETE